MHGFSDCINDTCIIPSGTCKYSEEELREHFDSYDTNSNGEISWGELLRAIKRMSGYGDVEVENMAKVGVYVRPTLTTIVWQLNL